MARGHWVGHGFGNYSPDTIMSATPSGSENGGFGGSETDLSSSLTSKIPPDLSAEVLFTTSGRHFFIRGKPTKNRSNALRLQVQELEPPIHDLLMMAIHQEFEGQEHRNGAGRVHVGGLGNGTVTTVMIHAKVGQEVQALLLGLGMAFTRKPVRRQKTLMPTFIGIYRARS